MLSNYIYIYRQTSILSSLEIIKLTKEIQTQGDNADVRYI